MNCRLEVIRYVLNSYLDIINSYGYSENTVKEWKVQLTSMRKNNQINANEKDTIISLLGLKSGNLIKAETVVKRVRDFNIVCEMLSGARNKKEGMNILNSMARSENADTTVAKVLIRVYEGSGVA